MVYLKHDILVGTLRYEYGESDVRGHQPLPSPVSDMLTDVFHLSCTNGTQPCTVSFCKHFCQSTAMAMVHGGVSGDFFFFFLRSPAISLGFTTFGWDFCICDRFFNPTIKVVTFRLRGWCVLGVFLLPAFTRLGHERQDLLSPCDEMHVCTD